MKVIYHIIVLLLMLPTYALAQQPDSASVSVFNRNYAADSVSQYLYSLVEKKNYLAGTLVPVGFNTLSIGHHRSSGEFIPAQSATLINDTYISTSGLAKLKNVKLWGALDYHKIREDSTRWAQQSRNNVTAPYYYGSAAFINYHRIVYRFRGAAERNMISSNLPVGVGIDYRIGDHYATNDPRGSVSDYQMNLTASVGYSLSKLFKIGVAGRYGYGQERISVGYKNEDYFKSSVYPDYINYRISGYGKIDPKNLERNYQSDQDRFGVDAYMTYNSNAIGYFILSGSMIQEEQNFSYVRRDSPLRVSYNDYTLNNFTADLIWKKLLKNKHILVAVAYQNTDGEDFAYEGVMANTYLYNLNKTSFNAILSTEGPIRFNYKLGVTRVGEERQDGLNGNTISYECLIFNGSAGVLFQKNLDAWGVNLNGIYSHPIDDVFLVPISNEQMFTRGVIYHDYIFNTSSYAGAGLDLSYNFPGYKKIQTGIRAGFNYIQLQDRKLLDRNLTSTLGNNRLSANLSLNLYF